MLSEAEKNYLSDISIDKAWSHVEYLSTLDKTSGTEGERKAHKYVRKKLKEYGVNFETYEFDSLISHPKEASLDVVSPTKMKVECITHSFSKPTPKEGMEKELVLVPVSPSSLFTGLGDLVDRHGPLPPARAVHFLRQTCDALREAHTSGLVHRDIKPANLFAARIGLVYDVAKLLDFGLVRETNIPQDSQLTGFGAILGTSLYMSPETGVRLQAMASTIESTFT